MHSRPRLWALALALSFAAAAPPTLSAQECFVRGNREEAAKRPSPLRTTTAQVGDQTVLVCYGAPSARGRTMIGGQLQPYGQPWRFGANEATSIHLPFAAEIAGVRVEPGSYSLWVIPGESEWEVHVNRIVERWGIPLDDAVVSADVGHGTVPVTRADEPVETLTMELEPHGGGHAELLVSWEHNRIRIPIHGSM